MGVSIQSAYSLWFTCAVSGIVQSIANWCSGSEVGGKGYALIVALSGERYVGRWSIERRWQLAVSLELNTIISSHPQATPYILLLAVKNRRLFAQQVACIYLLLMGLIKN
ncbi:hypothetical protein [uncultured Roseobacter sp.]|uniref:hypothetical protein n=1 Tax=uncultured Roseobacter sp. TaxID=114847 RepID=UPI0026047922|nr:hypothetical protein [uncultured Roseobacter sp.]